MNKNIGEKFENDPMTSYFLKQFGHDLKAHHPFSNFNTLPANQTSVESKDLSAILKTAVNFSRKGEFSKACNLHNKIAFCNDPSFAIEACLGLSNSLTRLGYLSQGACWASLGMALARHNELLFKMAHASWFRGNALLRAGKFQLAYDSFALDFALLPAGHPQRAWALSMQAHALGQMGVETSLAAETMYRIAAHMDSKEKPINFAYSGLALLGAAIQKKQLSKNSSEYVSNCTTPYILFRMKVATFLSNLDLIGCFRDLLLYSKNLHPNKYRWELKWLERLSKFLGGQLEMPPNIEEKLVEIPSPVLHPSWHLVTKLEYDGIEQTLPDMGFESWNWADSLEGLIHQRFCICL